MWQVTKALKLIGVLMLASVGVGGQAAANPTAQVEGHRSIGVVGAQVNIATEVVDRPGFALLLGASRYHSPRWTNLTSIPEELEMVGNALRGQGFAVQTEIDLPSNQLFGVIEEFIATHVHNPENRLVIYFAGHGYSRHTRYTGDRGYIVPIDAPHPEEDLQRFLALAIDMKQFEMWALNMEVAQALFIFDSCFSGTALQHRGEIAPTPLLIQHLSALPVRQFITAGGAGELVPAKSDFAPALAAALNEGLADRDGDGFITGTELGIWLQSHVSQFGRQIPWHGKLSNPAFAGGEFVFRGRAPRQLSAPELRVSGTLAISSNPSGAAVYVDGKQSGTTPLTIADVRLGERQIEIRADGHETSNMNIRIQAGVVQQINAELRRIRAHGNLWIDTIPTGATIQVKGAPRAYSPGMELPPGRYEVTVSLPEYHSRTLWADVEPSDLRMVVALVRMPERRRDPPPTTLSDRRNEPPAVMPRPTTCWSRNTFGQVFYWYGPTAEMAQFQAIQLCQLGTPVGGYCQPTGCGG